MSSEPVAGPPPITPEHYRILCGIALGVILLLNVQQGSIVAGLLAVLVGALGVLLRLRVSPLLTLLPIAGGQLYVRYLRGFVGSDPPGATAFEPLDLVLCMAVLGYVAGHYRLYAIWFHILPADRRRRYRRESRLVVPADRVGKLAPSRRSPRLLTSAELAWFVLQLPLLALLAQGVWWLLSFRWNLVELPPPLTRVLVVVWLSALGAFVVGQSLRTGRHRQMDATTARTMLQDVLWDETRGEQRRIGRWLAWLKLRRRPAAK